MSTEKRSRYVDSLPDCALWAELPANLEEKILDVTGPIQRKAQQIRNAPRIDWLQYVDAGMISQEDYAFLVAYQRSTSKEERDRLLDYFKNYAMETLVSLVQRICVVEEIQKFLVQFDDMLWEDMNRVDLFFPEDTQPWRAFLDLLTCADEFVRNIASRIITKFIVRMRNKPYDEDMKFFLDWLKNELRQDNRYLPSVVRCLQKLLRIDVYRIGFLTHNGLFRIVRLLSSGVKPQTLYQLVFCIWVLSFNAEVVEKLNKHSIIPVLMDILESCPAEIIKLPRVILATFVNLLVKPEEEGAKKHNAHLMIQCKVIKWLEVMRKRVKNIDDSEFIENFEVVEDIIKKYVAELSTFDEYKLEVLSGHLEWSVVHNSKPFWNENAIRLNENDHELLYKLISLLQQSDQNTVLCVAAHDLGEYMSHYPWGKRLVEDLGGKDALLKLLTHKHPQVKYQCLKTLQIMMLNNYDLLMHYVSDNSSLDSVRRPSDTDRHHE